MRSGQRGTSTSLYRKCKGKISTAARFGAGLNEYLGKLNIPTSTTCSAEVGSTAQRDAVVEKMENVIMADGYVIVKQLALQLDSGEASVCRILEQLGYMGRPAATD